MVLIPLTGAARFESAMAVRPIARSAHFMVHHLAVLHATPLSAGHVPRTASPSGEAVPVDGSVENSVENCPGMPSLRLGLVVPKRHARRSVTRTQVKGQIRAGIRRHLADLVAGDWVVRLRAPIDRKQFPSARSETLAALLHAEIDALLGDAVRRARRAAAPVADQKAR